MKKRILSLLCVLALCLGLLPTTALAADNDKPNNLYVGTTNIAITPYDDNAAYWTSDDGITWISQTDKPTADSYIHYDGNGTLTLHNVSIQGDYTDYTLGYGIYAMSSSGPVSLNIVLEEKNNVSGLYGINVSSDGGYASLNISGPGSLTVSSPNYNGIGIFMSSKTSDANLTIEGASVTASGNQSGGSGVRLITSQTGSPNLTIEVKGGNLQASGATNGIHFLSNANDATAVANLKVSGNAMVKASNISTTKDGTGSAPELKPAASGSDGTRGIIWDGKNGTVYGSVTLDENLTIGEGESLTIPEGASLDTNGNTITVENGGKLEGTPTGTVVYAPTITTESLPDGEVGTAYNQPLTATGDAPITWTVSGTLPDGLSLDAATGIISGTPTTEETSTFTVTATNNVGSASKEYTLNIKAVSVTGVKLDTDKLDLFTGESKTLTATVEPETATNKTVTWKSSDDTIATVDTNGKVTAVKEGTATITATAADGSNISATCTVKVTDPVYSMTTDLATLDFGSVYTGYDRPAAQTVTITNTGNQTLNLEQPASTNSFEVGTLSKTKLAPGGKATFTVQPKAGLAAGVYREEIQVSGSGNVTLSIPVSFSVQAAAAPQVTPAPAATPAPSDNITYYTCPSCGYHNWTATEAGYRCDNCGYLESTRQLSGYGNVKGSYTPGSGPRRQHHPPDRRREQPRPVDGTAPGQRSGPGRPGDCQAQEAAVIYST